MRKLPKEKGNIGKVRINKIKVGLKVKFFIEFDSWLFLILFNKKFFDNITLVFLNNRTWTKPNNARIGVKNII